MSTLKRPAIHQRPRETADDLDDRRQADPAGALCAHTGAIEGGLRLLTSSATRRAALAAPATAPAQPERKPMTKGQREQVARRAEAAMNGNVNLSWRDALISETEAFHDIKETP